MGSLPDPTMLRCVLLAAFVLGAVAQDQTCDAVSMTIAGGPCDGVVAPTKACGGKSFMPGDSSTSGAEFGKMYGDSACKQMGSIVCEQVSGTAKASFCNAKGTFCSLMLANTMLSCKTDADCKSWVPCCSWVK